MANRSHLGSSTLPAWAAPVVAGRANCTLDEAIALMHERGVQTYRALEEIANAVVDRRLRFTERTLRETRSHQLGGAGENGASAAGESRVAGSLDRLHSTLL